MNACTALFGGMGTEIYSADSVERQPSTGYAEGKVNGQGVDVCPVLASNWRAGVLEKLSTFKALQQNWNSYDSPPPSSEAIKNAASFLMLVNDNDLPRPRVLPVSGGGIQFEWNYGGRELEIEFHADGTLEYLWVPNSNADATEVALKRMTRREIQLLVSWLLTGE